MSLIRNGGFERGNTDFWTVETDGTLEIDSIHQKYGLYCGKYISGVTTNEFVMNNDYVEVKPFDLVNLFGWANGTPLVEAFICLYTYDVDYSYVGYLLGMKQTLFGSYVSFNSQITIPQGIGYVRAGFALQSVVDDQFYLDGLSCDILSADTVLSGSVLIAYLEGITSGASTVNTKIDLQMYNTFEADLFVTVVSGTSPTLDVVVYEYNENSDVYIVGTFTQAIGVGQERITLTHCTGRQLYIGYSIGGTDTPTFSFKVYIQGKR